VRPDRGIFPDALAVESVFTALNMRTALRLAEVRGVILLAAHSTGTVYSYAPREVKASVAGHGHAGKQQMQLLVRPLLSMKRDTGAAGCRAAPLAVALCHLAGGDSPGGGLGCRIGHISEARALRSAIGHRLAKRNSTRRRNSWRGCRASYRRDEDSSSALFC